MKAAIVAVGSEMLTPAKIDTNSLAITEQLNLLGIDVKAKAVVGDERTELEHVLRTFLARADLVVLCGGLGPTDDDLTREVVASVLNRPLAEDEAITAHLRARFASRSLPMPMPESNRRQAMVPLGARVIVNARGSAPGLWIGVQIVATQIERHQRPRAPIGAPSQSKATQRSRTRSFNNSRSCLAV